MEGIMDHVREALAAIETQQSKLQQRSAPWMAGEQLKDICRREPAAAELVARDLEVEEMGLKEAEKKIKEYADAHRTGNFACVTPAEAEGILREFYGLPTPAEAAPEEKAPEEKAPAAPQKSTGAVLDLEDFL